jgi:hypothetical protein
MGAASGMCRPSGNILPLYAVSPTNGMPFEDRCIVIGIIHQTVGQLRLPVVEPVSRSFEFRNQSVRNQRYGQRRKDRQPPLYTSARSGSAGFIAGIYSTLQGSNSHPYSFYPEKLILLFEQCGVLGSELPSARAIWKPEQLPTEEEQNPDDRDSHGVRQHHRHHGADTCRFVVALREYDDQREIRHQRRDDVGR